MRSRRSATVRLVLMGAAVGGTGLLAGCSQDVQRNRYASLADCVADYSAAQCRDDYPVGGYASSRSYYGPWYRSDYRSRGPASDDPGPGRTYRSTSSGFASVGTAHGPAGVETGSRGGFGSHGRVSARGG